MSSIGYYRSKYDNLTAGTTSKAWYINGTVAKLCTVIVKEFCTNDILCKYLNTKGQYRFIKFNKYYAENYNPKQIGSIQNIVSDIWNAQTDNLNIGVTNNRVLTLTNDDVSATEMEIFKDILVSPRVYLHIGTGTNDSKSDWLQVTITGGQTRVNFGKKSYGELQITVTLPKYNTITMLS